VNEMILNNGWMIFYFRICRSQKRKRLNCSDYSFQAKFLQILWTK